MKTKDKHAIARAERVRLALENEEIKTAFEDVKNDIYLLWEKTASNQEDERERLYRELHGLKAVRTRLSRAIQEGKKAQVEIDHGD